MIYFKFRVQVADWILRSSIRDIDYGYHCRENDTFRGQFTKLHGIDGIKML